MRFRVAIASGFVVAAVIVATGVVLVRESARSDRIAVDQRLERQSSAFALAARLNLAPLREAYPPGGVEGRATSLLRGSDTAVRIYSEDRLVFEAGPLPPEGLPKAPRPGARSLYPASGVEWRSYTRPIPGTDTTAEALTSLAPENARRDTLRRNVMLLAAGGMAVAAGLAALAAGFVLRPLRHLRRAADEVAGTRELVHRVPTEGASEVKSVSVALNSMLDRLQEASIERERATDATRRFVADAGHELRTPLATLGATLELLVNHPELSGPERDAALADALAEERRLAALTDALQTLALGDGGGFGDEREIDFEDLVRTAVASASLRHPEATFRRTPGDPVGPVTGSPSGLRTLVDNLLENAARHGHADEAPTIEVSLHTEGSTLRIEVDDDGPGIPPEEREAVFERFHRAPGGAGGGSGLGLALVAQQARRHGGRVRAVESERGGARFEVTILTGAA